MTEFREQGQQNANAFSQDAYPQHSVGLAASRQNQVAADGCRHRVDVRRLLRSVSSARARLLVRLTRPRTRTGFWSVMVMIEGRLTMRNIGHISRAFVARIIIIIIIFFIEN